MNDREKFLASSAEEREALAKIFDKAMLSLRRDTITFTDFLSEREYGAFLQRKKHIDEVPFTAFGGYEGAQRVVLSFGFNDDIYFPVSAVRFKGKDIDKLKHPDMLGGIMSLGLDRGLVGDIVFDGSEWIVFAKDTIAPFLADSLKEAGGCYVSGIVSDCSEVSYTPRYEDITGTVASLRADSVVSVMLRTSRSKAAEYIESQRFYLNQALCTKCDKEIKENDILNVRGHGKAKLEKISGTSKKGRIFINIQKYM